MSMNKHFLILIIFSFILMFSSSCNRNLDELAEKCQSGVVLVQTTEYYEMIMSNGNSLFFTGSNFNKETGEFAGMCAELDSLNPDIIYGTGFFISNDGKIATNRHVIEGNISEKEARMGLKKIIRSIDNALQKTKKDYELYLDNINSMILLNPDTIQGLLQAQKETKELFSKRLNDINLMMKMLEQNNPNDINLIYHNDVRIAYNNTFVQYVTELKPCIIREKSETDDLAIIQLNTKHTPQGRHIFNLTPKDMLQHYSYWEFLMHLIGNDKNKTLMMIGYNDGPNMAITDEGIMITKCYT